MSPRSELSPLKATLDADEARYLRAWAFTIPKEPGVDILPITTINRHIQWAGLVGLDPALTIAQAILETGWFASWWYRTPRRNPAGIGVTGAWLPGPTNPDLTRWIPAPNGPGYIKGRTYTSYAAGTLTQLHMLTQWAGLDWTPLAQKWEKWCGPTPPTSATKAAWGTATTIAHLGRTHNPNNIGWANPGDTYGQKIARIANQIIQQGQNETF